jgi:hypothetical protein
VNFNDLSCRDLCRRSCDQKIFAIRQGAIDDLSGYVGVIPSRGLGIDEDEFFGQYGFVADMGDNVDHPGHRMDDGIADDIGMMGWDPRGMNIADAMCECVTLEREHQTARNCQRRSEST